VIPLEVPPLRDRIEDVPLLARHFIREFSRKESKTEKHIADDALAVLMGHTWPGNVRELKNIMERLMITSPSDIITADDIPPLSKENHRLSRPDSSDDRGSLRGARELFEKDYIAKKLAENKWNVKKTAEAIGLERSNLHKKIKAYGLDEVKEK
jgi:two-component system nitrogen regulation response regulator NtrX